eukprot:10885904-Alexandrium_andersonii.AAC.1
MPNTILPEPPHLFRLVARNRSMRQTISMGERLTARRGDDVGMAQVLEEGGQLKRACNLPST